MMNHARRFLFVAAAAALTAATGCSAAASHPAASAQSQSLTLGFVVDPTWAQVPVAQAEKAFSRVGLNVKIIDFDTGPAALEALEAGQVDVATSADVPVAAAYIHDPSLRVIADNSAWPGQRIVADRSSGITSLSDLGGKKIGVPLGTSSQYYISAVLASYPGVKPVLVNVAPGDMVTAIANHNVAAVAVFDPYQTQVQQSLGANAVVLGTPAYVQQGLLITRTSVLSAKKAALATFLRVLASTDGTLAAGTTAAQQDVHSATGLPLGLTGKVLSGFTYQMVLPASLAGQLTALAKWEKTVGNIPAAVAVPDFSAALSPSVLPPPAS